MSSHRLLVTALTFTALCCISSQALALDGYEDRRGLLAGVAVGGGVGLVESEAGLTGIDQGRKMGFHLSGMLGGGIAQNLTVFGEANWWARSVQIGENSLASNHYSFNATANLFLLEGIYVEGGAGLAYASYDAQRGSGAPIQNYRELGLAVKGGGGFEFFVSGDVALGVRVDYTRHFYNNADFNTLAGGLTLRWY